ncbi:TPA: hypothetical protein ACOQZT_000501 [Serratia odorifera]
MRSTRVKNTDLILNSTEDQLVKALVSGRLTKSAVWRFRCDVAGDDEQLLLKTSNALRKARQQVKERKAKANELNRSKTAGNALESLLNEFPSASPDEFSSLTRDMVDRHKSLVETAFGRSLTDSQILTLWAAEKISSLQ